MFSDLVKALKNTRKTWVTGCLECSILPDTLDPRDLPIAPCDNCGIWLPHKQLTKDLDETVMCSFCHEMPTLRF